MLGKLITLVLVLVIGWVVYTQLFGSTQEREMGREVIVNAKQTVKGIFNIFKHEGNKIKEGTYDDSIEQLGALLDKLRKQTNDSSKKQELIKLSQETERIKEQVKKSKQGLESVNDEETKEDLRRLTEEVQKVVERLEE